jgi:FtsZ-interacting cell division protein YlmF
MAGRASRLAEWLGISSPQSYEDDYEEDYTDLVNYTDTVDDADAPFEEEHVAPANVTPIEHRRPRVVKAQTLDKLAIRYPKTYTLGAQEFRDRYRAGETVAFSVEHMSSAEAQRLIDFCGGMAATLPGSLTPIDKKVLILAPEGVEIDDERQATENINQAM